MKLTKELFFSSNLIHQILDNTNGGINVVDTDGILVYVNNVSANYLNQKRENMIGKHISQFYPAAVLLTVLENHRPILDKKIHLVPPNKYVVNSIPKDEWVRLISLANVLHCENPLKIEDEWIEEYRLEKGNFDITDVDLELVDEIPSETQMGKVYTRLILSTLQPEEDYINGMIRVYNDEICDTIDNYNSSAYYEPSYVITRAYNNGGF